MGGDAGADDAGGRAADLVGVGLDPELLDVGQAVIERAVVPEAVFGAADAAMARLDREGHANVPPCGRAGIVGRRTLAAHLIETIALLGLLVVPLLNELAGVEMGAAIAFVMDALAVEHLGTALAVQFRDLVEGQDIADDSGHDLGDRRAARHLDDGLVEDDFVDGGGAGGIGLRRLDAAPRRAGAPGNYGHRVGANLAELLDERTSADDAVHAVLVE